MIGDPGGRSSERNLLDPDTLGANLAGIKGQLEQLLDFGAGSRSAELVDNASWTGELRLLDFLRDVGKHATVNAMVAKESVRARMQGDEGISFTEFAYMLVQANDFLWLHEHEGCDLQVGGSDQWGNITAGIDLVRRRVGRRVHGLTWPLLLRSDGRKFGKSEGGNEDVWLSASRTTPYRFFQHWMQVADADVGRFLLQLTLLDLEEARSVIAAHSAAPERRVGQRRLAQELTTLVHGADAATAAADAAHALFGADLESLPPGALAALDGEVDTTALGAGRLAEGLDLAALLNETDLATSLSDARRVVKGGGVYVNNVRATVEATVTAQDLRGGRYLLLRRGRHTHHLVRFDP